jgi:hypothetical protein
LHVPSGGCFRYCRENLRDLGNLPRCGRWHALLHNTARPREAIASSTPSPNAEIPEISDENFDEEELKVFIDECTDFIGPFELEDEQSTDQSPFLLCEIHL